jgi:hypothetical protein
VSTCSVQPVPVVGLVTVPLVVEETAPFTGELNTDRAQKRRGDSSRVSSSRRKRTGIGATAHHGRFYLEDGSTRDISPSRPQPRQAQSKSQVQSPSAESSPCRAATRAGCSHFGPAGRAQAVSKGRISAGSRTRPRSSLPQQGCSSGTRGSASRHTTVSEAVCRSMGNQFLNHGTLGKAQKRSRSIESFGRPPHGGNCRS